MDKQTPSLPEDTASLQQLLHDAHVVINETQSKLESKQKENDHLREMLRLYLQKRFGPSSEKWNQDQLQIFNEAESSAEEESVDVPEEVGLRESTAPDSEEKSRKKGRRPLPPWLDRRDVIHDLSEEEKICPRHNRALKRIGEETSEQLEFIPATLRVIRNVRPKYACSECEGGVRIAPVPPQPIPKSMASPSLLSQIVVSKYCDALPLYRQSSIFARFDIDLPRTTMANWMIKVGERVQPIINLLRDELLSQDIAHCDETRVQVLKESGKTAQSQSYIWAQCGGSVEHPVVLFEYDSTRSSKVPLRLFDGFEGYVHLDGYGGYDKLFELNPKIIRVGCMAHCRRKFDESVKTQSGGKKKSPKQKKGATKAHQGAAFIKKLYQIESGIRGQSAEVRKAVRQERAVPILNEMKRWLDVTKDQVPPKSLTGRAVGYALSQWESLCRYVEDGRLEIDNNRIENAIRPFVIGRKNWLFSDTVRGAEASANIYSLVETVKANGLEPHQYLCHLLTELPKAKTVEEIERLMPTRWRPPAPAADPVVPDQIVACGS